MQLNGSLPLVPGQERKKRGNRIRECLARGHPTTKFGPDGRRERTVGRTEVMGKEEWVASAHSLGIPLPLDNDKGCNSSHDVSDVLA
jgi:hypothetical protein